MFPDWPASLPQNPHGREGEEIESEDNVIVSEMDAGPDKLRRRSTAESEVMSFELELSQPQLATLKTFYEDTLGRVKRFNWTDPETAQAAVYRFRKPPRRQWMGGDGTGSYWKVRIELERLP